jgi:hypothetical protein
MLPPPADGTHPVRAAIPPARRVWPWAEDVLFWGVNVGLIGFIVGLLTESSPLKRTFSPILGLSIQLGMLALALRLRSGGTAVAGRPIANSTPSP